MSPDHPRSVSDRAPPPPPSSLHHLPPMRPGDRRSGSLVPPSLSSSSIALPRRFSLRSIKRRSKSRAHDPDLPSAHVISPRLVPQKILHHQQQHKQQQKHQQLQQQQQQQQLHQHHQQQQQQQNASVMSTTVPTTPRPRRMMFFREQGVMRKQISTPPPGPGGGANYVDSLALIKKMPVLAEGWLYVMVHGAPGGGIKWMWRRGAVKRFAQIRGNVVLLYLGKTEPVREVFSVVGCAVSCADTVVNRKGAVEHNVNVAKNGCTVTLRLKTEAEADLWANLLRQISLVRVAKLADFQVVAPIGEGASGKVFLVRDAKTGKKLALKCMSKKGGSFGYSASEFRHAIDERLAHEYMNRDAFIVTLRHAFQTRDKLYLATEFCEGGDVYNFVDVHGGGVTEDQAKIITAQVLLGLKALHDEGIVFRDLKPENVLLDRDGRVRLADFGLCKLLDTSSALTRTVCGTFSYAAAEILEENGYGMSCDLWALGTFLYHIMIGRPPRVAQSLQEARDNIFNSKEPIIWYSDVMSEEAMSLVTSLIEIDPTRRLGCGPTGISEVCSHAFFKDLDWLALAEGNIPPCVINELPPVELGDLRNFNQEEWKSIRMDPDADNPSYTESVLWPPRNLVTNPLPNDFLVSYSYSIETAGEGIPVFSRKRPL